MAFQSVPETAQINIIYTYNSVTCENVLYGRKTGGYSVGDLAALAAQIDTQINSSWLPLQPAEAVYLRTEVRGLENENDLVVENNTNTGPGTDLTDPVPNNVTFAIRKSSGLTGRSARGRLYWIGIPRDKLTSPDENNLLSTYVTALVDAVDDQRVGINAVTGWAAVLVSRFQGGAKRAEGVTFPWLSTGAIDARVDTQRGRLPSN